MRWFQIALFTLGTASMIGAAFGIGKDIGETLFNAGIALLLIDVVCIQLWPSAKRPRWTRGRSDAPSATPPKKIKLALLCVSYPICCNVSHYGCHGN